MPVDAWNITGDFTKDTQGLSTVPMTLEIDAQEQVKEIVINGCDVANRFSIRRNRVIAALAAEFVVQAEHRAQLEFRHFADMLGAIEFGKNRLLVEFGAAG
jgi:hypothetical protein